jgi:hypothetical protein
MIVANQSGNQFGSCPKSVIEVGGFWSLLELYNPFRPKGLPPNES